MRKSLAGVLSAVVLLGGFSLTQPALSVQENSQIQLQRQVPSFKTLDLPTWDDVQAAKKNKAAAAQKVTEIEALLVQSQNMLEAARAKSESAMKSAQDAELQYQVQKKKTDELNQHAKESEQQAQIAINQAASLVSQMYRSGGVDRNLELFLEGDGDTAEALLDKLSMMQKATERNTAISQEAQLAMNNANSLSEQAALAEEESKRLYEVATKEFEAAAAKAAEAQREEEAVSAQQVELQAQLDALKDEEATTVEGYKERVRIEEEQRRIEEARRKEEERKAAEAARKAEEERRKNEAAAGGSTGGSSGGGSSGGNSGPAPSSGWQVPVPYSHISTYFQQWWGHTGVDLVNGCGTPIRAANDGTITFVGWMDNIGGNMIYLNHGGGYQTRYAHLQGFNVSYNQWVSAGQIIGYLGTTGLSTGCHLHYEVLKDLIFLDPYNGGFV